MRISELEPMFNKILKRTENIIKNGERRYVQNEHFFQQQFTQMVANHYARRRIDAWQKLIIVPEHPTKVRYSWKEFGLNRPKTTRKLALNRGVRGKFDLVILDEPRVHVEWKGPKMYSAREVAMDLTKLLMLEGRKPIKIFAAIVTSSRRGDANHISQLTSRFYDALEFVQVVLDIDDIRKTNLYAFIATVPDGGAQKFIWGKV